MLPKNYLANLYLFGCEGLVQRNVDKAIELLTQAAGQGYVTSLNRLGRIYFEGEIVEHNLEEAERLFTLSAQRGDATGYFYLGIIYLDLDLARARGFFAISALKGDLESRVQLSEIYAEGKGVGVNNSESEFWKIVSEDTETHLISLRKCEESYSRGIEQSNIFFRYRLQQIDKNREGLYTDQESSGKRPMSESSEESLTIKKRKINTGVSEV